MTRFVIAALLIVNAAGSLATAATFPPDKVATVVVHGFDPSGARTNGMFGADLSKGYVTQLANTLGLPTGDIAPTAPNQIAYSTYYGDQHPPYYTAQDITEVDAAGNGVPRYALIMAKYIEHVVQRSGAEQANIYAISFGGLISRYMIEKDLEGLASSGKIARWIVIEGLIAGNHGATNGGDIFEEFYDDFYDAPSIDVEHMEYEWVRNHINDPRKTSSSPFLGQFPVHIWLASDDDFNEHFITLLSEKANDGVQLIEDSQFENLPPQCLYLGLEPTLSTMHTNHESTKDYEGLRAGIGAQIFGRKRVTIILEEVRAREEFDGDGSGGNGEYVFGVRVFSPQAQVLYNITNPIHQVRADDASIPYVEMEQDTSVTVNLKWFDDLVQPNETELRLESNVEEVDGDLIYGIDEEPGEVYEEMDDITQVVSVVTPGRYTLETDEWRALINVHITEYPPFEDITAAQRWDLYE